MSISSSVVHYRDDSITLDQDNDRVLELKPNGKILCQGITFDNSTYSGSFSLGTQTLTNLKTGGVEITTVPTMTRFGDMRILTIPAVGIDKATGVGVVNIDADLLDDADWPSTPRQSLICVHTDGGYQTGLIRTAVINGAHQSIEIQLIGGNWANKADSGWDVAIQLVYSVI
jgi:hypothetical protein